MKEKSIQMAKRILTYCTGLFVMAMGVSFSGTADLGMSPVNSIPYVLSEICTQLSMGTWIIVIFSLYIAIQFILLGKDFQPWRILQLICTTLFPHHLPYILFDLSVDDLSPIFRGEYDMVFTFPLPPPGGFLRVAVRKEKMIDGNMITGYKVIEHL